MVAEAAVVQHSYDYAASLCRLEEQMQRSWRMAMGNMLGKVSASCDGGCCGSRGITWMKSTTAEVLIYVCHSCVAPVQPHEKLCVHPSCAQE